MDRIGQQDLYEVLQVSPRAHPLIITKAFRLLAALYHPDNKQTGDERAFKEVVEAYRLLSDPLRRSAYDRDTFGTLGPRTSTTDFTDDSSLPPARRGADERELRDLILRALYDVRRGRPYKPGLSLMVLSELFGYSIEDLQFTLWFLRGKGLIETSDDSEVVVTVDGVDYLEANGLGANAKPTECGAEEIPSLPLPRDVTPELLPEGDHGRNGSRNGGNGGKWY
jgi:curved DNA-binding protein